jgi:hypothetical protein
MHTASQPQNAADPNNPFGKFQEGAGAADPLKVNGKTDMQKRKPSKHGGKQEVIASKEVMVLVCLSTELFCPRDAFRTSRLLTMK